MTDLYYAPVFYGIHDLTIDGESGEFGLRVYYPSEDGTVWDVDIRPGRYPLIVFVHGDRSSEPGLCPEDASQDYKRWGAVLHLLARCGFVVAIPAVHDIVSSSEDTAVRVEDTVQWMRRNWKHNETLHHPAVFTEIAAPSRQSESAGKQQRVEYPTAASGPELPFDLPPIVQFGLPTSLGLAGHSWGARACARVAVRGNVAVKALGSIAGTWDENAANMALVGANLPTLMMAGTDDWTRMSYVRALWSSLPRPKHQAAMQGLDHWDWFGSMGGIQPCNEGANRPACPVGWQVASELLLGLMVKYVGDRWFQQPYLLGSPQGRPPLLQWFSGPVNCALKIRWDDPSSNSSHGNPGEVTLGTWSESSPW